MRTLENKLFQFETMKNENVGERYLLYLCQDIINMVNNLRKRRLFHTLSPYNKKIAREVENFYLNNKYILDFVG